MLKRQDQQEYNIVAAGSASQSQEVLLHEETLVGHLPGCTMM